MAGIDWLPAIWLGACSFGLSILVSGLLTPGYSHLYHSISELGERKAPNGGLVRWVGFIPLGLSFLVFAIQSQGYFSNYIPYLIFTLTGLAVLLSGIFPTDPHNRRDTPSGKVHAIAVISLLFLLSLSPFILSTSALYRSPPAGWFLVCSLLMGMLNVGFFATLPNGGFPQLLLFHRKSFGERIETWYLMQGLHQRLLLSLHCIWWFVFTLILANA